VKLVVEKTKPIYAAEYRREFEKQTQFLDKICDISG
jgi:hypothetical protein